MELRSGMLFASGAIMRRTLEGILEPHVRIVKLIRWSCPISHARKCTLNRDEEGEICSECAVEGYALP